MKLYLQILGFWYFNLNRIQIWLFGIFALAIVKDQTGLNAVTKSIEINIDLLLGSLLPSYRDSKIAAAIYTVLLLLLVTMPNHMFITWYDIRAYKG